MAICRTRIGGTRYGDGDDGGGNGFGHAQHFRPLFDVWATSSVGYLGVRCGQRHHIVLPISNFMLLQAFCLPHAFANQSPSFRSTALSRSQTYKPNIVVNTALSPLYVSQIESTVVYCMYSTVACKVFVPSLAIRLIPPNAGLWPPPRCTPRLPRCILSAGIGSDVGAVNAIPVQVGRSAVHARRLAEKRKVGLDKESDSVINHPVSMRSSPRGNTEHARVRCLHQSACFGYNSMNAILHFFCLE